MARGSSRAESEAPKRRKNLREGSIKERVGDVNNEERSAALAPRIAALGLPKTGPTYEEIRKLDDDTLERVGGIDNMKNFTKEQWKEYFTVMREANDASITESRIDTAIKDMTNDLALGEILTAQQRKNFKPIDDGKLRITSNVAADSGVSDEERIAFYKDANRIGMDILKTMIRPERLSRAEIDSKLMSSFEDVVKSGKSPGYALALMAAAKSVANSQIEMAKYGRPDDMPKPRFSYIDLKDGNTYVVAPATGFKPSLQKPRLNEAVEKGGLPPRISY